ncbi:Zinc/iron permease [Rhizodiscina lignyota]|uniref:Zinc/iron permease n=1 Tax=Rhizodiscina lignyota TaxID=1504668 RepID=A0A9P4IDD4_9PEZI|nr:Zinc/iron permease [Rhizodiscina lignyota]
MTAAAADNAGNGDIFFVEGELVDISGAHWQGLPTELLQTLLAQRQAGDERPACGSGKHRGAYNTPIHVFALFLILFLSTAACAFPIIVKRFPNLSIPHSVLFISRHFGTGVLIATAFVHLLPTAFVSLNDPCLPYFWNTGYPAMPGAIAMIAVIVVVGVEMFFASRGAGHSHNGESETDNLVANRSPSTAQPSPLPQGPHSKRDEVEPADSESDMELELDELDPMPVESASHSRKASYQPLRNGKSRKSHPNSRNDPQLDSTLKSHAEQQKLILQCLLLEAGILFHSVFIGMALSVSTGPTFIIFLVAISFHQTFEGLALGARISALAFPPSSPRPWLMALAFGTTTPFGQALGLGVRHLYDPQGQTGLIVVGVTNAISSGLLLFAGLVGLLAEDFLSDESYVSLTGARRLKACIAVVAGAALMALVGAWA